MPTLTLKMTQGKQLDPHCVWKKMSSEENVTVVDQSRLAVDHPDHSHTAVCSDLLHRHPAFGWHALILLC